MRSFSERLQNASAINADTTTVSGDAGDNLKEQNVAGKESLTGSQKEVGDFFHGDKVL